MVRGGKGAGARPASWAARQGGAARQKKGKEGEEREEKIFLFLISIFYMNAFTCSNNQRNAWFGMVQQIKEINSRVYHYHIT
jgi:hypothetical protein